VFPGINCKVRAEAHARSQALMGRFPSAREARYGLKRRFGSPIDFIEKSGLDFGVR